MNITNLDIIFTDKEKTFTLTDYEMAACEQFRINMFNRPYHNEMAYERNTTPELMAYNFKIGVQLEIAARKYLKSIGLENLSKVDLSTRDTDDRGGHNPDLHNDIFNFNCKAWDYYNFNRFPNIKESYTFQKTSLNAKSPDTDYLICGVVQHNQVSIRAVLGMERVKSLLLPPYLAKHANKKTCLYAETLLSLKEAA